MSTAAQPARPRRTRLLVAVLAMAGTVACGGADVARSGSDGQADGGSATAGAATRPVSAASGAATGQGTDEVEAVAFDSGDLTLRGDLRLPRGTGPHPGAVLVHGSGPVSREGEVPGQLAMSFPTPVAVLADLAEGLRDAGYAVLTYDKRSCGPFNGCADNAYPTPPPDLGVDAFARDGLAAAAHLRSRPDVQAEAVAVAGHSQGATLVPGLLLDDPALAAGIMISAPFDPVDELLAEQAATVEQLVASADPAPPGAAQAITQVRELATEVAELRSGGGDDDVPVAGASAAFWRSWLRASDGVPQLARQAEQPILVVAGGADTTVGPRQTAQWRRLADEDLRITELDCVSHALNCLGTDDPAAVEPAGIDDHVDARVIDTIAGFLDDTLR